MIFLTKHIARIIQNEENLHRNFQKDKYIIQCYSAINAVLVKHLDDYYLIHRAYFRNEKGHIEPLGFNDLVHKQNPICKTWIDETEGILNTPGTIPFTKILLDRHCQGLVLYSGKRPKKMEGVISQNLNSRFCSIELAKKLGVRKSDIAPLVCEYQFLSRKIKPFFYAYLIRPFAKHKEYNGIFLIQLKRPLAEEEFVELGNLWTKVLSETAVIDVEKVTRDAVQEYIFEEQTHTWNTEIASIQQHLNNIFYGLEDDEKRSLGSLYQHLQFAFEKTKELGVMTGFNLFLMKSKGVDSWNEMQKIIKHSSDNELVASLSPKDFLLSTVLLRVVATLEMLVDSFAHADENATATQGKALKKLKEEITQLPKIKICAIETGVYIVLLDLVKNAIFHTDWRNIKVEVNLIEESKSVILEVSNNEELPLPIFNYINEINRKGLSPGIGGGLRTIKRILKSPLLCNHGKHWKIRASRASLKGSTKISLSIPKAI